MGYDGAMFLSSIILLLPILAVAGVIFLILRWLRFVPGGVVALPAYGLIVLAGYALLFLATSLQMLVLYPSKLQTEYLGRAYGTPLTLRTYEHSGFQDPADEWTYAVGPDAIADLKQRCLPRSADRGRCYLFTAEDLRRDAAVWLEGNKLYMLDGLH